ncbi:IPT/TIG domain-containing protein [Bradyrhizobium erythrophlei]|nr:IPT/TIG domain-containing protein [Bradyrhizobium erythrophlei]
MADARDSASPQAVVYQPTPTQHENDLTATTGLPPVKQYDGSPIDPQSPNPAVPHPPGSPIITSLVPTTGALPSAPIALTVDGSGFTAAAKVIFNQNAVATTFVSSSQLTCSVTAAAAGSYPVEVHDSGGYSNVLQFTFTATAEDQPQASRGSTRGVKRDDRQDPSTEHG